MSIKANHIDVVSLDVDGNEYYFAKAILAEGILPKLFIIEYSGKFPPPIRWSIEYDPNHQWDLTDYQGASLSLLADLLRAFSYSLVCCNGQTGVNAFFVRNEFMSKFADIPREIEDIFVSLRSI